MHKASTKASEDNKMYTTSIRFLEMFLNLTQTHATKDVDDKLI